MFIVFGDICVLFIILGLFMSCLLLERFFKNFFNDFLIFNEGFFRYFCEILDVILIFLKLFFILNIFDLFKVIINLGKDK